MIKHIIWDLDGTLVNSEPEILFHLNSAIGKAGVDPSKRRRDFRIGPTIDVIINEAYVDISPSELELIIGYFREGYDNCGFKQTHPFDGIESFLDEHSALNHYIVTNKPMSATCELLKQLDWESRFKVVKSPYVKDGVKVTKSQLMLEVISEFNIISSEAISIGDMATDSKAAKANGIFGIGVTWGTGTLDELNSVCDVVIQNVSQIGRYL